MLWVLKLLQKLGDLPWLEALLERYNLGGVAIAERQEGRVPAP